VGKSNRHTFCAITDTQLRVLKRSKDAGTRGLAKLALACWHRRGVRLSEAEVAGVILMDDALHSRLWNELAEMSSKNANRSTDDGN